MSLPKNVANVVVHSLTVVVVVVVGQSGARHRAKRKLAANQTVPMCAISWQLPPSHEQEKPEPTIQKKKNALNA